MLNLNAPAVMRGRFVLRRVYQKLQVLGGLEGQIKTILQMPIKQGL
ncbi:MAG: hypothetical protein ACJASV_000248 [Pseudorhodobacter sp.]|jgi:hypothetical protein